MKAHDKTATVRRGLGLLSGVSILPALLAAPDANAVDLTANSSATFQTAATNANASADPTNTITLTANVPLILAGVPAFTPGAGQVTILTGDPFLISGGANGLTMSGQGELRILLSGANAYTGTTTLNSGTLSIASFRSLGASTAPLQFNGGTLKFLGNIQVADAVSATSRPTTLGGTATYNTNGFLATQRGVVSGTGTLVKTGAGALALNNTNTYIGGTTINQGMILVGNAGALGTGGTVTINGGGIGVSGNVGTVALSVHDYVFNTAVTVDTAANSLVSAPSNASTNISFGANSTFTGAGSLVKQGAGNLTFQGASSYTGGTTINAGSITGGVAGLQGAFTVNSGATLVFSGATTGTFNGSITGAGNITKIGTAVFTLNDVNTYAGGTTITGNGTPGGGGLAGTATSFGSGNIALASAGSLTFNQATNATFGQVVSGAGALTKTGAGALRLTQAQTYTGGTTVAGGTLWNDLTLVGPVSVSAGATFAGAGAAGGAVTASGALAPGGVGVAGTMTLDSLVMDATASLNLDLATPGQVGGVNDLLQVNGDLTLDGSVSVTELPGFTAGAYRIINYTGALTDNGLALGALPLGYVGLVQTAVAGQVNLVLSQGAIRYWDYNGVIDDGVINGGAGTWMTGDTRWTTPDGLINDAWDNTVAVFTGAGATVTLGEDITYQGMQFTGDGYTIAGGGFSLTPTGSAPVRVDSGVTATIAAPITGAGGLTKTASGTLVLTGANTYAGGTSVTAGTLQGDAQSLQGAIANSGTVAFVQAANGTFGGVISGGGSVTKTGIGTLSFAQNQTYTGGTTVAGGGLSIAADTLKGAIVDNGLVTFNQAAAGTFAGAISGTGAVTKTGAGNLTLSGANTFSGGLTIAAGTVTGAVANLGAGPLTINGTLALTQSTSATFAGAVGGGGTINKSGAGAVTFSGPSTFTGAVNVSAGSLTFSGGGLSGAAGVSTGATLNLSASSLPATIANAGTVAFSPAADTTFSGAISGAGVVTKSGANQLTLTGVSTYTGATTVNAGSLAVNGALNGSTVQVLAGGTLKGTGQVAGLAVAAGGIVAPGNSIGTLTVNGPVSFAANSVFQVEANPSGADRINATGAATIAGGQVQVLANGTGYGNITDHTILSAQGGVSGTFASVTSNLAFLVPFLSYTNNSVVLRLQRNDVAIASVAQTENQKAVAQAIDAGGNASPFYLAALPLSSEQFRATVGALSGELYASMGSAILDNSRAADDAVQDRLRGGGGRHGEEETGIWFRADTRTDVYKGDRNAAKFSQDANTLFMGVDRNLGDHIRVGAAGGYVDSDFALRAYGSKAKAQAFQLATYLAAGGETGVQVAVGASAGLHRVDTRRSVSFGSVADETVANFRAKSIHGFAEAGYRFAFGGLRAEPFAAVDFTTVRFDRVREDGTTAGGATLDVASASDQQFASTVGLRAAYDVSLGEAATLTPFLSTSYRALSNADSPTRRATFDATAQTFTVTGVPQEASALGFEGGLNLAMGRSLRMGVRYAGQGGDAMDSRSVRADLAWRF